MTFEYTVKEPADVVFEHLTHMQPESKKVSSDCMLSRHFRILFIPCRFSYKATVETDWSANRICLKSKLFRMVEIKRVYQLKATGNITKVRENVIVKGNAFLQRIVRDNISGTDMRRLSHA